MTRAFSFLALSLACLPAAAQQQRPDARPRVRAITAFVSIDREHAAERLREAAGMLRAARGRFEKDGWKVETIRITTQPFPEYLRGAHPRAGARLPDGPRRDGREGGLPARDRARDEPRRRRSGDDGAAGRAALQGEADQRDGARRRRGRHPLEGGARHGAHDQVHRGPQPQKPGQLQLRRRGDDAGVRALLSRLVPHRRRTQVQRRPGSRERGGPGLRREPAATPPPRAAA